MEGISTIPVLGTELAVTTYEDLARHLFKTAKQQGCRAVDFSNTHIVTMRRHEKDFRDITAVMDLFVPDGMPLIWCMNARGAGMRDRVYGPTFLRECIRLSPPDIRHYFLGGNQRCLDALLLRLRELNPNLSVCGSRNGYFKPEEEFDIVEEIQRCDPDMIWVGLGTPKQQDWIKRWKGHFSRGILLAVGFAFDVNAGTKSDAPLWMQKVGLTWVYRICSEPKRLFGRYLKWNSLFAWYLLSEMLFGKSKI